MRTQINFFNKMKVDNCDTDVIETDVCITKDNQVVCFHDTNMLRLCGIDKDIEEFNLSEIKYSKEIELDFTNKKYFYTPE